MDKFRMPVDAVMFQEFVGYLLLPTNKAQRMMIIKGNGGEGKSQIGTVLKKLFGINAKDGSISKISENQFARADLEHIHLLIDDDMRMEALKQTNYVKSLVTATSKELMAVYAVWCDDNGFAPLKSRTVSDFLIANAPKYHIEHTNNIHSVDGRRVWGFKGIRLMIDAGVRSRDGLLQVYAKDNPFTSVPCLRCSAELSDLAATFAGLRCLFSASALPNGKRCTC